MYQLYSIPEVIIPSAGSDGESKPGYLLYQEEKKE
jgi:hypothetical protein